MDLNLLWETYKKTGDIKLRNRLIVYYAPLVKYVAGRIYSKLPKRVDVKDLISSGTLGLIDAVEKFNLNKKVKFETYASSRIKGAIIDFLRSIDWVPRHLRSVAKDIDKVTEDLKVQLGRDPTDEEIAEEMGISVDKLYDVLSQLSHSSILALDELIPTDASKGSLVELRGAVEDEKAIEPASFFEEAEEKQFLTGAIEALTEREKNLITLYYYQGLTLKEIGKVLGVSESRVSQLHAKALLHLKNHLRVSLRGLEGS